MDLDVKRINTKMADEVNQLIDDNTRKWFGYFDVEHILYHSYTSLAVYHKKQMIAAISLDDHPTLPALPPQEWRHFLYHNYNFPEIPQINETNTLWIHLLVWNPIYTHQFIPKLFQHIFRTISYLDYVILLVPPLVPTVNALRKTVAIKWYPNDGKRCQTLYLLKKSLFLQQYKIRHAIEEDNDDVIQVIDQYTSKARQDYGDYYLVDLLKMSERQLLIAEHENNQVVGVLCLNRTVNLDLLNEKFELVPYHGLRKPSENDYKPPRTTNTNSSTTLANDEMLVIKLEPSPQSPTSDGTCTNLSLKQFSIQSDDDLDLINVQSILMMIHTYSNDFDSQQDSDGTICSIKSSLNLSDFGLSTNSVENQNDGSIDDFDQGTTILYRGEPNVFVIEIAAVVPGHESCLNALYGCAFECYPDRDYCVATLPGLGTPKGLVQHFKRVIPKPNAVFPHEMYVAHRNVLHGTVSVRMGSREDRWAVLEMLSTLQHRKESIEKAFLNAIDDVDGGHFESYLLLNESKIVGLAVVNDFYDFESIHHYFHTDIWIDLNQHKSGTHLMLEGLVMSPIFQRHSRLFLREIHRLTDCSLLYYRLEPSTKLYVNTLKAMVKVLPKNFAGENPDFAKYALFITTKRILSTPKIDHNQHIVVVGGGESTIGFLEALFATEPDGIMLNFTNVTVVAAYGFCHELQPNNIHQMIFVSNGVIDHRYIVSINLRTEVNTVVGWMDGIDRKNKFICIENYGIVPYDYLVLLCGEQFQLPSLKNSIIPINCFVINCQMDATNAFLKLKIFYQQNPNHIIVYGDTLEAYCCLATLLDFGVNPSHLIFILPPPPNATSKYAHLSTFNDDEIKQTILEIIKTEGITIYFNYHFCEWILDDNTIELIKFQSKHHRLHLDCTAIFMYDKKMSNQKTYDAVRKAGLIFDGGLVIESDNSTIDPFIFGAGAMTKYSRKYHADILEPRYYDKYEIGKEFGKRMKYLKFAQNNLGVYKKPIVKLCHLPGKLYYLSITKPGKPIPLDIAITKANYGRVFVSGNLSDLTNQGYFRLHLNQYDIVETITCLSHQPIQAKNLMKIWGKHESLLNNFILRYEWGMIEDIFEYFNQEWCQAIYHERFDYVLKNIENILVESSIYQIILDLEELDRSTGGVTPYWKIVEKLAPYCKMIEDKLVEFLEENHLELPNYAHSIFIAMIMQELQNNSLFFLE